MGILRTALYCRLSKDDMAQGDSESIKTQKAMLTQYAREHGFLVVETYVDDGWSGLNFDRPDFNRMLDDIEAEKIDVVITVVLPTAWCSYAQASSLKMPNCFTL